MASATFKKMVNMIRVRKECIEVELESRVFEHKLIAPTELLCATWFIRGQLDKMQESLDDIYWNNDTDLTHREYKSLDKHIDRLQNYYWHLLYDKGIIIIRAMKN